ncbi:MAG TPA: NAD(P)H-binding protein [Cyclobacteriaceae bacterium]|nr:NAD(P)H-binding protein [Cyclobacteriaceae bacterium]
MNTLKNYVITGSIGNISKPLVTGLVKAGKNVTVITSNASKAKDIEQLGAKALVGSVSDNDFVKKAFARADVVYTMIPPIWQTSNWRASQNEVGNVYVDAIRSNNINYVVNLSSLGAHHKDGVGPVNALYDFEQALNAIPGLNVKHLRPSFFYYNLFAQIGLIKHAGIMGANYGEQKIALVHPRDIAEVALQELLDLKFSGNSVRHIVSDERTGAEVATALGKAIGKDLPWVIFSDADQLKGLLDGGVPNSHAPAYVEMGAAFRTGKMQERLADEKTVGKTKLEDFAKEFSAAYNA